MAFFFRLIQTLSTFWAKRIWILIFIYYFWMFWTTNFWISQISKFPEFQAPRFPNAAGAGGVWKSGSLEFWEFGDLGNPEICGPKHPEIINKN